MKKLFAAIARAPKRTAGLAMLAAVVIVPAVLWAWGPDRPLYTVEKAAPHVTFNSITNNQRIGNETNFVRIREAVSGTTFTDNVQLQAGKTYEVMVFYHNNARSDLNDKIGSDGKPIGVARNVAARVQMPGRLSAGSKATITGFISASNAKPQTVWDNAYGTTTSDVALRIVPGSAKIASSNGAVNGKALPNELFTTGTPLGYNKLDGVLPGCNQYSGYITYRFVVDKPDFTIDKQISIDGGKTWTESAKTTPGSTVQYRLIYKNTGTVQQDNVILKDTLPAGVTYVPGSSQIANATTGGAYKATVDGVTGSGGYKIGSFTPGSNNYFKFSAKIPANDTLAKCGDNVLTNKVTAVTENGSKNDTANVTVPKECKPAPKYTCDSLTVTKLERTKFTFNTKYTVQNATFKHVTYVVKNAAGTEVYRGQNATFATQTVGKYTVEAIVTVTVDGVDKTATGANCKKEFEVTPAPAPGVSIEKKVNGVDQTKVAVNEEFTYQLVVKNTGNTDLTNVKVADNAPANVQFITADKGTITDNKWSYTIASLKVGQSITIAIKAKVTKYVEGTIKNTACVDMPNTPTNPDDCDDATVTPKKPNVSIEKKVDGVDHKIVALNKEFTYNLTVKNTGEVNLTNVKVTDKAPNGVQFISADKGMIIKADRGFPSSTDSWSYTIPELKTGQSITIAIKAKATKESIVNIKNTACVDAPQVPGTPDDCDDATIVVPPTPVPAVTIDKKVDGVEHKKVALNQEFTYQIVVTNTGTMDLKNVTVTDNAPAHVQFIAADKGTIANNKWSYVIPELKIGQSVSFAIKAKATAEVAGKIVNTACVDATEITGTPDDCDDASVEVSKTPVTPPEPETPTTPTPETPGELPTTGITESLMAFIGLGSLVASVGYYIASRRILGAL